MTDRRDLDEPGGVPGAGLLDPLVEHLRSMALAGAGTAIAGLVSSAAIGEAQLWDAAVVTAMRYVNNQAHNHMGFVSHALLGAEDARRLVARQPLAIRRIGLCQALHQVVADMHDPSLAPFELVDHWPRCEPTLAESIEQLRSDVAVGECIRADHRVVGLQHQLAHAGLVDLLLEIGLAGVTTDEHTLLTPAAGGRICARLGERAGFPALRWAVRYSASFEHDGEPFRNSIDLMDRYGLGGGAPNGAGIDFGAVRELVTVMEGAEPSRRPELAAMALAHHGCSPASVLGAASLVGCHQYLMVRPVAHEQFDAISREVAPVHIGTVTNALREAVRVMSPRTAVLAAIQAGALLRRGPSILNEQFEFVPFEPGEPYPRARDVARFLTLTPDALLDALRDAVVSRDIDGATAAVAAYGRGAGPPGPLLALLTGLACTDNGSVMHNMKHLRAMISEFRTVPEPERWQFLVAAARFAAWYAGLDRGVYDEAVAALDPGAAVSAPCPRNWPAGDNA